MKENSFLTWSVIPTPFCTIDHHEYASGSPLMALLLLLGIPAWICCCCRKKIFRPKSTTTTVLQVLTVDTQLQMKSV